MRDDIRFADVLEATLRATSADSTLPRAARPVTFPSYATPFIHLASRRDVARGGSDERARPAPPTARASSAAADPAARPRRRGHDLTPTQQAALRELIACGAELRDDFTVADLKRTFKDLARRYHPDRHPHATGADHARLAATFARVHAGYRELSKKVES